MRPVDIDQSQEVWTYRPHAHKTAYRGRERLIFVGPAAQQIITRYLDRPPEAYCFRPSDSEAIRQTQRHAARKTPLSCGNRPGTNRRHVRKRKLNEQYAVDAYRRAIHRACDAAFPPPPAIAQLRHEPHQEWIARLDEQQSRALARWRTEHRWSPNRLRHSAATEIRKRYGLEAAATVLGHAKADVTQIYAERDYTLAANVARQIG